MTNFTRFYIPVTFPFDFVSKFSDTDSGMDFLEWFRIERIDSLNFQPSLRPRKHFMCIFISYLKEQNVIHINRENLVHKSHTKYFTRMY